jgi:hypothetical protein
LLSVYTDVIGAYALASAPSFEDDQHQMVRTQLLKAEDEIKGSAAAAVLQPEIHALIAESPPVAENIKKLLASIQHQISKQRHASEQSYLKRAPTGRSNPDAG